MGLAGTDSPHPVGSWRDQTWQFVHSPVFSAAVMLLVLTNCICLAVDVKSAHYYTLAIGHTLDAFDTSFIALYTVEAAIMLTACGPFTVR